MNMSRYVLIVLLCTMLAANCAYGAPKEMDLRVTDPGGSSEWAVGSANTIKWSLKGEWTGAVTISLQRVGWVNARMTITEAAPIGTGKTGSFKWPVPADLPIGDNYSVTVTADNGIGETSNEFKIVLGKGAASKLALEPLPKGGEKWMQGSAVNIRWSYAGNAGPTVKLVLLKKEEGIVAVIAEVAPTGVDGKGQLPWTVPVGLKPGGDLRIGIASTTNPFFQDTSKETIVVTTAK